MRALAVAAVLCLALAEAELASLQADKGVRQLLTHSRYERQRKPPPPRAAERDLQAVSTQWFTAQKLDHFDPTNTRTWSQRYFANPSLFQDDGPVFIFIEGEAEASSGWIATGGSYMYSLAKIFKAKMYVLEHRFFGQSKPTDDISTDNLKWLTPDQALADLAYFIEYLTEKGEMTKGQKLAVFGGSYPGNLAAWARLKYPHLIHAAVASSAPVRAEEDYVEYMEVVTRSMRKLGGDACADNLQKAYNRIKKLIMTDDGLKQIQDSFYMCDPLDTTNKVDMDFFYEVLANPLAIATQYNRDNSYDQYSLKKQCAYLEGDLSEDDAVEKLAELWVDSVGFILGCVAWDYASNTQSLQSVQYGQGDRQWVYMTCTTFGYFQTADGDTVFPKGYFDVPYFLQQCKDAFGEEFGDALTKGGVSRTNIVFGSTSPDVENVMFVNGEIDPWHALGVLEDVNDKSPAILISSTSHCYDMYPNDVQDSDELLQARDRIKKFVQSALYESPAGGSPTVSPDE